MARLTTTRIKHWYPAQSSIAGLLLVAHFTDPCVDFFPVAERFQRSFEFRKGVRFASKRTNRSLAVLDHEFDTIAGGETEAVANFLRHGDLAFGANGAGIFHLYLENLK